MNIIRSVFTRKYVSEKNAKNKMGAWGEKKKHQTLGECER